jgi:2'-5' RNA ligase
LTDEGLRPVRPEALHVTLCFLGYQPEREIDTIAAVMQSIRPGPVSLRFEAEPKPIPPRRPRLFALDAPGEDAVGLQSEVEAALVESGHYTPEKRPFWPHVTVARVRVKRGDGGAKPPVGGSLGVLPDALLQPFLAVRVALYRSTLRPSGAEYARLAGLDLRGDEEDG